ncbi:MAG: DEAD/DEAH box helicase, partial [Gammaproteobacteria bacterium]|nr:DEAD/DEAH box helicase [Gammaproteobacteria bacterium]
MTVNEFASLPIKTELLASIASLGYEHMTPIQAQTLPLLLKRQDLLAQAKTGSGKT